ncbi:hypothetical protein TrST_g13309 [Triparma strigata]|uniref:Fe2OG dioxygenase domain-containing protein n=1 Tax=Triparma strigata TaxID=1606541 RepID=A0A9W7BBK6_9STRA|nr:hypothetical protein TrST_g13309 [Triparma strigata]
MSSLLPPMTLENLVNPSTADAIRTAASEQTFVSDSNLRYEQATDDIEVDKSPAIQALLLRHSIPALIRAAVRKYNGATVTCFDDVFVVRYDASKQRALKSHVDGGDVSFMLALSSRADYEGGGTKFSYNNDDEDALLHLEKGSGVVFDAATYHEGVPITKGTRYLLVAFCYTSVRATRVPEHITLDLMMQHGNRNKFELYSIASFSVTSLKPVAKRLAAAGKSTWVPFSNAEAPSSLLESFALKISLHHLSKLGLPLPGSGGCEIWSHRLTPASSIPWHQDKDERHSKMHPDQDPRHPLISTVTYLKTDPTPTIIFGDNNTLVSSAVTGNHVAFSGELIHGVISNFEGSDSNSKKKKKKKKRKRESNRLTLLINIWAFPPMLEDFIPYEDVNTNDDDNNDDDNNDDDNNYSIATLTLEQCMWKEIEVDSGPKTLSNGKIEDANEIASRIKKIITTNNTNRPFILV